MKILIVCKHSQNSEESKVCNIIEKRGFEAVYSWKNTLSKKDLIDIDFVVAIGGDGTVLSASHYLVDKPILTVNSSPKTSEGVLTKIPIDKIYDKLDEIKENISVEKLERISVFINNKKIPLLALNEVFIANKKSYLISKYKIKFNGGEEIQRSSGLIFSTGTGSTAWFKSAGGKPFNPNAKFVKMIVREPYEGKFSRFLLKKLTLKEDDFIEVVPMVESVLAVDSIREFKLRRGDVVRIKISKHPLLRIK